MKLLKQYYQESCGCNVPVTPNGGIGGIGQTLNNYNSGNAGNAGNVNNSLNQNNQNMNTTTNSYAQGWRGCTPPAPIVLTATVGDGIITVFKPDSTGLFAAYGGTSGGQSLEVAGPSTMANLNAWLLSGWLYVKSFSLQSTVAATLQNSVVLVTSQMDGSNLPQTISSSANVTNTQFNPLLLNVCCGFILTNTTALRIPVTSINEVVTLTLTIGACGYYGQLPDFLASNPVMTCGSPNICGY